MRSLLLALAFFLLAPVAAQTAMCVPGEATADLDVAGVRARLYNTGGLFWRGDGNVYEVPRGSGVHAMFAASLWLGGEVDGTLHFAGSNYGPWEYAPGPLDASGATTAETCAAYDRLWTVTAEDVAVYAVAGTATPELAAWPVGAGAPFFVDADRDGVQDPGELTVSLDLGDPGYGARTIDLAAGERPAFPGRQAVWWVMNDVGVAHDWSRADPLGVEVRVLAYAFGEPGGLSESTFYRYEVLNRSDRTIRNLYGALFADLDLGDFNDDYVFTDPDRSLFGVYNGNERDEGSRGYGSPPPALGIDILSGGYAAMQTGRGPSVTWVDNGAESYSFMSGYWRDGTPLKLGGDGYNTNGPPVRWIFSGDPPDFWSEENFDGQGSSFFPGDRSGSISARLDDLAPGERDTLEVAILFGQGGDRHDSVDRVKALSDRVQALYDADRFRSPLPLPPAPVAPDLEAPAAGAPVANGGLLSGDDLTFTWYGVPGADRYRFQILTAPDAVEPVVEQVVSWPIARVDPIRLPLNRREPLFWRVLAVQAGVPGAPSETRQFRYFARAFDSFAVVANAAGPLAAPEPAADPVRGFPTPGGAAPSDAQQMADDEWTVSASGAEDYAAFLATALPSWREGASPFPHDYEIRFTGPSLGARAGDGATVEVPFEVWDIGVGTPDDPADDVRLVPVLDDPNDDGTFSLLPSVEDRDDPWETETMSWARPTDMSPGDAGYRAWSRSGTVPRGPIILRDLILRRATAPGQSIEEGTLPEIGTVFRISSSGQARPIAEPDDPARLAVTVRPNPTADRAVVGVRLAEAGAVRVSVVDVLGREVALLAEGVRAEGEHRTALDTSALVPGLYVVVVEGGAERASQTITVVR